jgi:hypothetical protein
MLTAPRALKSSDAASRKPREPLAGFSLSWQLGIRSGRSAPSKEKIGDLIERVKDLNAHDDERCDHQIETKMHCDLCSKAFMRHARLRAAGNQTHELLEMICTLPHF